MARRQILSLSERESLLALPDDELTLTRMAYFSEHDLALIRGLTLSGTKTHVKQLWLRKTKGSGEDPLVC